MTIFKKLLFLAPCLAMLMSLSATTASADPASFNLTNNHCTDPSGCGAPGIVFGVVTLAQNGGNVDVTVQLNSPYVWAKTSAADFMAFKFNVAGVPVTSLSVDQTFSGQTLQPLMGNFNADGTGSFLFGISCPTCGNGIGTINSNIAFHVANTTEALLTQPNNLGDVFVADIGNSTNGVTGSVASTTGTSGPIGDATRAVDATTEATTPEPSSLVTLGFAVLGLGLATRRLKV